MNVSLQATLMRWWEAHHDHIYDWNTINFSIVHNFFPESPFRKNPIYDGHTSLQNHIKNCCSIWTDIALLVAMQTHQFIHILDTILQNWYLKEELKRQIVDWDIITTQFCSDFSFFDTDSTKIEALKLIRQVLFPFGNTTKECSRYGYVSHRYDSSFHEFVAYGEINKETHDDLEDLSIFLSKNPKERGG